MESLDRARRRLTSVLFGGVALANTGYIASVTVSTLAARSMTGTVKLAGLPAAVAVVGTATGASILAGDVRRAGRRRGLIGGYALAATGGAIAASAVVAGIYPLLLLGLFCMGFGQAASQLSRYAAGDIAVPARRGSAVALVVWAGTVGAVLGPSLLGFAGGLAEGWGQAQYMGGYMLGGVFTTLSALGYALFLRPDPAAFAAGANADHVSTTPTPDGTWSSPLVRLAVMAMASGQIVMMMVMTGTPIHIEDTGRGLEVVGLVISAHTIGMFAFSPLTGRLVDVFGTMKVLFAGMGILVLSCVLAAVAPDASTGLLATALFLLGVGWNANFVAGSALLSRNASTKTQGSADSVVWASSAMASLTSGIILDLVGYPALAVFSIVLLVVPSLLLVQRRQLVTA